MTDSSKTDTFPQAPLAAADLRDHASPTRVAAIWTRLETGLPGGAHSTRSFVASRPLWPRTLVGGALLGGVFALGGAFALGVAVGANGLSSNVQRADAELALQAEPRAVGEGSIFRGATGALGTPQATRLASDRTTKAQRAKVSATPETSEVVPTPQNLIEPSVPGPVTPLWQLAAQQGEYQIALGELEASGGFETVAAQADADQLMYLADVARATGFKQRAVMAWRRVISQHASDPQASLAAWSLGNVLEQSGDQLGAAEAFAAYRGLSPQGDFAEDALVREIRMAAAQQNAQLANRLAAQYDQAFPNGRRAQEIQEQLAKLQRGATVSADAGAPEAESAAPQK